MTSLIRYALVALVALVAIPVERAAAQVSAETLVGLWAFDFSDTQQGATVHYVGTTEYRADGTSEVYATVEVSAQQPGQTVDIAYFSRIDATWQLSGNTLSETIQGADGEVLRMLVNGQDMQQQGIPLPPVQQFVPIGQTTTQTIEELTGDRLVINSPDLNVQIVGTRTTQRHHR